MYEVIVNPKISISNIMDSPFEENFEYQLNNEINHIKRFRQNSKYQLSIKLYRKELLKNMSRVNLEEDELYSDKQYSKLLKGLDKLETSYEELSGVPQISRKVLIQNLLLNYKPLKSKKIIKESYKGENYKDFLREYKEEIKKYSFHTKYLEKNKKLLKSLKGNLNLEDKKIQNQEELELS